MHSKLIFSTQSLATSVVLIVPLSKSTLLPDKGLEYAVERSRSIPTTTIYNQTPTIMKQTIKGPHKRTRYTHTRINTTFPTNQLLNNPFPFILTALLSQYIFSHTLYLTLAESICLKLKTLNLNNTFATLLTAMLACYRRLENPRGIWNKQAKTERGEGRFLLRPPLHFEPRRNRFLLCIKGVKKIVFKSRCYAILVVTCEQGTCIFLLYRPGRTSDRSDQVVAAPCLCGSLDNAESCPPEITENSSTICR